VFLTDLRGVDRRSEFHLSKPFGQFQTIGKNRPPILAVIMPERLALTGPSCSRSARSSAGGVYVCRGEKKPRRLNVMKKFQGYVPRTERPSYNSGPKVANFDRVEWTYLPDPPRPLRAPRGRDGLVGAYRHPTSILSTFEPNKSKSGCRTPRAFGPD